MFRILIGTFLFYFNHLARLPDTSSTFIISKIRIYLGVGYTWTCLADFMLVEEYRFLIFCEMPPLLATIEVDILTISSHILLLKSLESEQFLALINVMLNSHGIEKVIEFIHEQNLIYRAFVKKVGSGDYDL